ncbi:MAG: hypothetical protein DI538_09570, partial [Azospira oryzae]
EEGDTKEKVDGFRQFLKEKNYKNGHVTIDTSDWYVDSRLVKRLKQNPAADVSDLALFFSLAGPNGIKKGEINCTINFPRRWRISESNR